MFEVPTEGTSFEASGAIMGGMWGGGIPSHWGRVLWFLDQHVRKERFGPQAFSWVAHCGLESPGGATSGLAGCLVSYAGSSS